MGASSSASLVQDSGLPTTDDTHLTILSEEMSRLRLRCSDIPSRFSTRKVRGHGRAQCNWCLRKWTSHQASAKIDLKKPSVRVWRQKCKDCDNIVQITFKEEEFRKMINNMLDRLRRQMRGEYLDNNNDANSGGKGPPHCKELCEGCDWGDGDCRGTAADGRSSENPTGHAGGGTTGSGNGSGDDSSTGLKIFGAVALGAVGLLAAGAFVASAFSDNSEEEEQKRRGRKK